MITIQDSTNPQSGALYNLGVDANACPVGTGIQAGFCGSAVSIGTFVTISGGTPHYGKAGIILDTNALIVTSNGSAPLPAPVDISTGIISTTHNALGELWRNMLVRVKNVRVTALTQVTGGKTSGGLTVDDGSGPAFLQPSPQRDQHLEGNADIYSYLQARG